MLTRRRISDLEAQSLYASVPQYYDFLQNRVLVNFKPRHEDPTGRVAEFELMLSKKMTYEIVSCRSHSQHTMFGRPAHSDRWHTV